MHVPAGLHVPVLVSKIDDRARAAWDRNEVLIKRLARIDSLSPAEAMPKGTVTIATEGATFGLPLAGIIDIAEEQARLEKTLAKLDKDNPLAPIDRDPVPREYRELVRRYYEELGSGR